VAAPGLLLGLINPPLLRTDATSSVHRQASGLMAVTIDRVCVAWRNTPAQKNDLSSVCRGNIIERAMPMLLNGLPTKDFA